MIFGKNIYMAKALDYIFASIIVTLTTFVWSALLFKNAVGAIVFSIVFSSVILVSVRYFSKRNQKPYTYDRLETEFCIRGGEYIVNLIKTALKNPQIENGSNYILLEKSIIIANFKFSALGGSDVANVCKTAKKHGKNHVYLITKSIDRHAWQIANLEDINIEIVKAKQVYKFLAKHNALPVLKKPRQKFSFKALLQTILSRRNFKNYAFSGAVLVLVSFLTPLKIYYIVFGTILLAFALLSLTPIGNGTINSPKVFEELEKENEDEYKREEN